MFLRGRMLLIDVVQRMMHGQRWLLRNGIDRSHGGDCVGGIATWFIWQRHELKEAAIEQ